MMKVQVLGCFGGEMPGHRTTCFMIDDRVLLDAGAATAALSLDDQALIDAVILSHSHLDHVRDVGFLIDNVFGRRNKPLMVHGLPECIKGLKAHVLNNLVWPDFSALPTPEAPVMAYNEIAAGVTAEIEGLKVTPYKVNHSVSSAGFVVSQNGKSLVFSGDTGPTEELWKAAAAESGLAGVFIEVSFPNRLAELAEATGHLTPGMAQRELDKLGRSEAPVYVYHMKPQYLYEIREEVQAADYNMRLLKQGDRIEA